jgi:steroid delta-isomerase-like uncharacterized protein
MKVAAVTRRYIDAFGARDVPACLKCFAPDGTYSDPNTPSPLSGDAIAEQFREVFAAFPDATTATVALYPITDELTAWRWIIRGTHAGPLRGLPATGRAIVLPGCEFIQVRRGSIQRVDGYFDRLTLLAQLGAAPAPASSAPR